MVSVLIDEIFLHDTLPNAAFICQNHWVLTVWTAKKDKSSLKL